MKLKGARVDLHHPLGVRFADLAFCAPASKDDETSDFNGTRDEFRGGISITALFECQIRLDAAQTRLTTPKQSYIV